MDQFYSISSVHCIYPLWIWDTSSIQIRLESMCFINVSNNPRDHIIQHSIDRFDAILGRSVCKHGNVNKLLGTISRYDFLRAKCYVSNARSQKNSLPQFRVCACHSEGLLLVSVVIGTLVFVSVLPMVGEVDEFQTQSEPCYVITYLSYAWNIAKQELKNWPGKKAGKFSCVTKSSYLWP